MATIGSLTILLSANTARLERNMTRAQRTVRRSSSTMERHVGRLRKTFDGLGKRLGGVAKGVLSFKGALASAAAIGGLGLFIKRSLDAADSIAKAADRIGISTEALQRWRHAAELAGVSQDELDKGLLIFTQRLGEATAGKGTMIEMLRDLDSGLLKAVSSARSTDQALLAATDGLAAMEDQAKRNAAAVALFGRAGARLNVMLKDGTKAFRENLGAADRLGIVLGDRLVRSAEATKDQLTRVAKIMGVNLQRAALTLAPTINRLAESFIRFAPAAARGLEDLIVKFAPAVAGAEALKRRLTELYAEQRKAQQPLTVTSPFAERAARPLALGEITTEIEEIERELAKAEAAARRFRAALGITDRDMPQQVATVEAALRFQLEQLSRTTRGQQVYTMLLQAGIPVLGARSAAEERYALTITSLVGRLDEGTRAQAEANKRQAEAAQLIVQAETPYQEFVRLRAEYTALLPELTASLGDEARAHDVLASALGKAGENFVSATTTLRGLSQATREATAIAVEHETALQAASEGAQAVMRADAQLAETIRVDLLTAQESYNAELFELVELRDKELISTETFTRGVLRAADALEAAQKSSEKVGDATRDMGAAFKSTAGEIARDMDNATGALKRFLLQLIEIGANKLFTEELFSGLGSAIGGAILGGGGGGVHNPFTGVIPKQHGGAFAAGQALLVGERGPEILTPGRAGTVIPNEALGGGTVIAPEINFFITTGVAPTVRAEVMNLMPVIEQKIIATLREQVARRGGGRSFFG